MLGGPGGGLSLGECRARPQVALEHGEDRARVSLRREAGGDEGVSVGGDVLEAGRRQACAERAGQDRVGEVVVPGVEHPLHALGIVRVPRHGRPVDVPQGDAATGAQRPMQLGQRGVHVGQVLEHLDRDRRVELLVLDGECRRLALAELDVRTAGAPGGRETEHLRAPVDADHETVRPDLLRELRDVEAGAAAGVQDPLSGQRAEGLVDDRAPAKDVVGDVRPFQLLARVAAEGELAHERLMGDVMRSPTAGRELVRLGRRGGRLPMPDASVSGRLGEAQARWRPAPPAAAGPERPRRARSRSRTREIVASTIYVASCAAWTTISAACSAPSTSVLTTRS